MKLTGWRLRSYPLEIYAGDELIWSGETEKSLGYIHLNVKPVLTDVYKRQTIPHADLDIMGEAMTEYEGEFCETPFGGSRDGYKSQQNPRAAYAAMVTYLDKSVGLSLIHI